MIKFNISAPGRIVLSGEHAVMYDEKKVVMASLDRRTTLKFCELPEEQEIIKIEFSKIDLSLNIPLREVREFSLRNDMHRFIAKVTPLFRYVRHFIDVNSMWSTREQRFSLQTFFFLLFYTVCRDKLKMKSFHVHVSTELPIRGGLGSSTSFTVCLAACFIHWACLQNDAHVKSISTELTKIYGYATLCEYSIRDYAIEFDDIVCTYGKIQSFQYLNFENRNTSICQDMPEMKILLIDAKICRNNRRERLQRMVELKHICPEIADHILNKVNAISQKIFDTLYDITCSHFTAKLRKEAPYAQLQQHIQENQQILYSNGLSHPRLDNICSIAESYGFAGKLTGFGGGFVYILLPPSIPEERITNLRTKLEAENCDVTMTNVGCSGVRIDN